MVMAGIVEGSPQTYKPKTLRPKVVHLVSLIERKSPGKARVSSGARNKIDPIPTAKDE